MIITCFTTDYNNLFFPSFTSQSMSSSLYSWLASSTKWTWQPFWSTPCLLKFQAMFPYESMSCLRKKSEYLHNNDTASDCPSKETVISIKLLFMMSFNSNLCNRFLFLTHFSLYSLFRCHSISSKDPPLTHELTSQVNDVSCNAVSGSLDLMPETMVSSFSGLNNFSLTSSSCPHNDLVASSMTTTPFCSSSTTSGMNEGVNGASKYNIIGPDNREQQGKQSILSFLYSSTCLSLL